MTRKRIVGILAALVSVFALVTVPGTAAQAAPCYAYVDAGMVRWNNCESYFVTVSAWDYLRETTNCYGILARHDDVLGGVAPWHHKWGLELASVRLGC